MLPIINMAIFPQLVMRPSTSPYFMGGGVAAHLYSLVAHDVLGGTGEIALRVT